MSGEDWKDVKLTLSTASPSIAATRPVLTPLHIVSVDPTRLNREGESAEPASDPFEEPAADDQADEFAEMVQALREQQQAAEAESVSDPWTYASDERDLALNTLANRLQEIELKAASRSWQTLAPDVNEDLGIQVYALSQPVSLDARREQQLVQILETQLAGEIYHVATPLLSTYAYREAELTNTQPCGLLGGPATVYLDDRFVGCTQIPSTASGQSLTIGCGADQQVRTRRELRDKQDQVQGGNRQLKFVYRLVLSNFKDEPVAVRTGRSHAGDSADPATVGSAGRPTTAHLRRRFVSTRAAAGGSPALGSDRARRPPRQPGVRRAVQLHRRVRSQPHASYPTNIGGTTHRVSGHASPRRRHGRHGRRHGRHGRRQVKRALTRSTRHTARGVPGPPSRVTGTGLTLQVGFALMIGVIVLVALT